MHQPPKESGAMGHFRRHDFPVGQLAIYRHVRRPALRRVEQILVEAVKVMQGEEKLTDDTTRQDGQIGHE
jgi:hypothetical protein